MHTNFEKVIIALILIYFKDADALFFILNLEFLKLF